MTRCLFTGVLFGAACMVGCSGSTELEPLPPSDDSGGRGGENAAPDDEGGVCERYCHARAACYSPDVAESCAPDCDGECPEPSCDELCVTDCEDERHQAAIPNDCVSNYDVFLDCASQLEDPCSADDVDEGIIAACNPELAQYYVCQYSENPD